MPLGLSLSLEETFVADQLQISKRFDFDNDPSSDVHYPSYNDNFPRSIAHCVVGMACIVVKAKIGYAGYPGGQR